jgi:hypothetical protein
LCQHPAKNPYRPGSRHHDLLPRLYVCSYVYGVYAHGQRLTHGRHGEVEPLGDGDEVLLGHHGILGHPSVAGKAYSYALLAQLRGTGETDGAAATALYRNRDDPISRAYPCNLRPDCLDDARKLVTQRYRRLNPIEPGI